MVVWRCKIGVSNLWWAGVRSLDSLLVGKGGMSIAILGTPCLGFPFEMPMYGRIETQQAFEVFKLHWEEIARARIKDDELISRLTDNLKRNGICLECGEPVNNAETVRAGLCSRCAYGD